MKRLFGILSALVMVVLPDVVFAQGLPDQIRGLHGILQTLKDDMIPLCEELIGVGRALAGFAAVFYIGYRVWRHIANADAIDFFPLLRPFALGLCILNFPLLIKGIDGILSPIEVGTAKMVENSEQAIAELLKKREQEMKQSRAYRMYVGESGTGNRDLWLEYAHPEAAREGEGMFESIGNDIEFAMSRAYYNFKNWMKEFVAFLLQLLYEAAALCLNTIRTFNLIILIILGPLILGLSVFDGFHHTLTVWLSRYINVFLWLPIANILGAVLGKIQQGLISIELQQLQTYGETFFTTSDVGYLIFMIIGIVAYLTVPNLANHVIHVGGGSALTERITRMSSAAVGTATKTSTMGAAGTVAAVGGTIGMVADGFGDVNLLLTKGTTAHGSSSGYFKDKLKD